MEDLIGVFFAIIAFAISVAAKSKKSKSETAKTVSAFAVNEKAIESSQLKPAAPAGAAKVLEKQIKVEQSSMEMASDHQHEGRQDVPCPAVEREMPRMQPKKKQTKTATVPGLNLAFDRNTVLQGFVMSEILNRPRSGMRR